MKDKVKGIIWLFFIQLISGCLAIYIVDKLFAASGYNLYVGINEVTAIVAGVLGIPGVAMMFGLAEIFKSC